MCVCVCVYVCVCMHNPFYLDKYPENGCRSTHYHSNFRILVQRVFCLKNEPRE